MNIQMDLWTLISFLVGLLLAFITAVFAGGKLLLSQVERRLDERFKAQDAKFAALEQAGKDEAGQWRRVERDLLRLQADLPLHYVRREDYIRNQTVIEAKLDAVALKIENLQLKGLQS